MFTSDTLRFLRAELAGGEFPPEFAFSRKFYPTLLETYRAVMPLVRFLNEPLSPGRTGASA